MKSASAESEQVRALHGPRVRTHAIKSLGSRVPNWRQTAET